MAKPAKHGNKWRIRWIDATGKRRSEVYIHKKEADFALRRHQTEAEEIKRGLRKNIASEKKGFKDLCEYYLKYKTPTKKYQRGDKIIINVHLLPFFGEMYIDEIQTKIDEYKFLKKNLSSKTIHNHLTMLISLLRVAHTQKWIDEVPKIEKPKIHLLDKDFSYLKTDEEIRKFLIAAKQQGEQVFHFYNFAINTGLRAGEVAGLKWSDIDFETGIITVQRSYTSSTKNGEVRHIPILNSLMPSLRKWKMKSLNNEYVFYNANNTMFKDSARIFQEVLHRTLKTAKFEKVIKRGKIKPYITFHDLRHTFASTWMRNGGNIFKLQKILGHKSIEMTLRYSHIAPTEFEAERSIFDSISTQPSVNNDILNIPIK